MLSRDKYKNEVFVLFCFVQVDILAFVPINVFIYDCVSFLTFVKFKLRGRGGLKQQMCEFRAASSGNV